MKDSNIMKVMIFWGTWDSEGINVTKCTASLEPSDVSLQSNKDLKIWGDNFFGHPVEFSFFLSRYGGATIFNNETNLYFSNKFLSITISTNQVVFTAVHTMRVCF